MSALAPPIESTATNAPLATSNGLRIPLGVEHFFLPHASWELFTKFFTENPERRMRLTYADGEMFFMSPLPMHESWKELIGTFVKDLCTELGINRRSMGSTTWLKASAARGIESDECYYIASEAMVRGKTEFDLARDPPPDLAIEIDATHSPIDRPAIYAALGVPELWVYDGKTMTFFKLVAGKYEAIANSVSFPFLMPIDIERHLAMIPTVPETAIALAWRQFVREKNPPTVPATT